MKTIIRQLILILVISLVLGKVKKGKKNRYTPKAVDLANHYGGPQIDSRYGPSTSAEEHVENNLEVFAPQRFNKWQNVQKELEFKPYPGWENKLNPHQIKSGDLTNVAPSSSKLVTPQITGPKLHVQTEVNYPSQVKLPTFYGFKKEYQPVTAYDREEGKIVHDNIILNKPIYGWEDGVTNIKKEVNQYINLNNGEEIKQNKSIAKHGIERPEPGNGEAKRLHGKRRLRRRI